MAGEYTELPYTVVYMSSSDEDAIVRMRQKQADFINTTGWVSAKNCERKVNGGRTILAGYFPQEITLQMNGTFRILRVQVLTSHQYVRE